MNNDDLYCYEVTSGDWCSVKYIFFQNAVSFAKRFSEENLNCPMVITDINTGTVLRSYFNGVVE